jgi:hypothetical protein
MKNVDGTIAIWVMVATFCVKDYILVTSKFKQFFASLQDTND